MQTTTTTTEPTSVTIEAAGVSYTVRALDVNTACLVEDLFGEPISRILEATTRGSFRHMRGVLWAAMQQDHPALTLADVGAIVDAAGGMAGVAAAIEKLATKPAKPRARRR